MLPRARGCLIDLAIGQTDIYLDTDFHGGAVFVVASTNRGYSGYIDLLDAYYQKIMLIKKKIEITNGKYTI